MTGGAGSPGLRLRPPPGRIRALALVAHGGESRSHAPGSLRRRTALRMLPFVHGLRRAGGRHGLAVAFLRYRVVGYNDGDPVEDIRWALDGLAERYPDVPVCLLGHSMGGRAALRAAGHDSVAAVVALAPWLPEAEPTGQLAGRSIVIAHGMRDRVTHPAGSLRFALEAIPHAERLCRFEVARSGHAMLERARLWHRLARDSVLGLAGLGPLPDAVREGFELPADRAARIAL